MNPTPSSQSSPQEVNAVKEGVVFIGPILDVSGYGLAARYYAAALGEKIPGLRIQKYSFAPKQLLHDDYASKRCRKIITQDPKFVALSKVRIVHCPPRDFSHLRSTDAYNIGITVWETDRLNEDWVKCCNDMDEIWIPCNDNKKWFEQSGVTSPVYVVPHIAMREEGKPQAIDSLRFLQADKRFIFYSVFVWQNRKNPLGTLATYFTEFGRKDNVLFVLKVDRPSVNPNFVEEEIKKLKKELNLPYYPPIQLVYGNFSDAQMTWLHQQGDCYFLLQHSEGWGLPHFEALCNGTRLVTTGFGGPSHFVDQSYIDKGCACLIDGFLTPVRQDYKYYSGQQNWMEPDVTKARRAIRLAYVDGKRKFPEVAEHIKQQFDFDRIGMVMRDRVLDVLLSRR